MGSDSDAIKSPRVEIQGDAFEGPGSLYFWSYGNKTPQATLEIKFTPRHPGDHFGQVTVHKHSGPMSFFLYGRGDSTLPTGVFAHLVPPGLSSTMYPPGKDYWGDSLFTRTSLRVRNHGFSSDSLRIQFKEPKRFNVLNGTHLSGIVSFTVPPDSTLAILFELDSTSTGTASQEVKITTNAENLPTISAGLFGQIQELPAWTSFRAIDTFRSSSDNGTIELYNSGGRTLTVDLPELSPPFYWLDTTRHFELGDYGQYYVRIGVSELPRSEMKHTYWIRSNASNIGDSVLLELIVKGSLLDVGGEAAEAAKELDLTLSDNVLLLRSLYPTECSIYDMRGVRVTRVDLNRNTSFSLPLERGVYFVRWSNEHTSKMRKIFVPNAR